MRLVRLEDTEHDDMGTWNWSVDYASVALGDKTFWLPATIRSEDIDENDTVSQLTHAVMHSTARRRLVARYSHYRQAKAAAPVPVR